MLTAPQPASRRPSEQRTCPHHPPCPDHARTARVVVEHPEFGLSLLCNGGILFHGSGRFLPPRTRDAAFDAARVVVHAWGFKPSDVQNAIEQAYDAGRPNLWQIVHLVLSMGAPCPIQKNAPLTVGYSADDGQVWAAYLALDEPL